MRCYNGQPDKELQALLDEEHAVLTRAEKEKVQLTYFPAEEGWIAFRSFKPVSGFHSTPRPALEEALR